MTYLLRSYTLPADLEELVAGELWGAGTLGFQVVEGSGGRVRVEAYFPGPAGERVADDPLAGWNGVENLGTVVVPEQDWLAPWRERARPFDVGEHFRVDPREPEEGGPAVGGAAEGDDAGDRRLLRLPARAAFGVGSHESTRLALELLETLDLAGRSVLDVGTGTGILAFAALHRGARRAVAFDVDPAAAVAARDNSRLNRLHPWLFTGTGAALAPADDPAGRFDWTLINVVPEQVARELPDLARRSGGLVLSGILAEKGAEVLATLAALGFREHRRAMAGEWIAFVVERPADGPAAAPDGLDAHGKPDHEKPGHGKPVRGTPGAGTKDGDGLAERAATAPEVAP